MNRHTYFSNFIWRSLERWGALGISFIVSIILARILDPSVYGTIAIVNVLITILDIFLDSGFGNSLIQKKDADDIDFSSVFFFNIFFSFILYIFIFFLAPIISEFFNLPELIAIVRVMGISVMISGVKNIQQSYVSKNMLFRKFFFATLVGTISAAIVGIFLAYKGFGVWALVAQYLCNNFIDTFVLWLTVRWRPKMAFSFQRIKELLPFASKLLLSSLIFQGYTELRQVLIGKFYTKTDLAHYNQGYLFPNVLSSNLNSSINSIMFPAMSSVQNDKKHVRSMMKRSIQVSQYVICPCVLGLAACANSFVKVILTDKWLPSVPYLQLFCLAFMFGQMGNSNQSAAMAVGRSDIKLKTEIGKTGIDLLVLIVTVFISPLAIAIGYAISTIPRMIVCALPSKKLVDYSFIQQIKDIIPNLSISFIMALCVWLIGFLDLPIILLFLFQIIAGIVIYIGLSILTKNESFEYVINLIRTLLSKNKENK